LESVNFIQDGSVPTKKPGRFSLVLALIGDYKEIRTAWKLALMLLNGWVHLNAWLALV